MCQPIVAKLFRRGNDIMVPAQDGWYAIHCKGKRYVQRFWFGVGLRYATYSTRDLVMRGVAAALYRFSYGTFSEHCQLTLSPEFSAIDTGQMFARKRWRPLNNCVLGVYLEICPDISAGDQIKFRDIDNRTSPLIRS